MKEYPIDGTLDLHVFDPSDVGELVPEYIRACREKGILEVRIIHGKGTGTLRRQVRSILDDDGRVVDHHKATDAGGWGATVAHLSPPEDEA
ncbi:MAG: DNA mismatch repair protein MutS [Bacteroidetes bacterium SW_11_64_17]|nr:MAG: DNA mismatch repair protein MutS [Bacteroidetes bacterium SW_11_64_17]